MNFVGIFSLFLQSLIHKSYAGCTGDVTNITNTDGKLTSPNYPWKYDNELDCTYIILSPTGKPLTLVFRNFDVEYDEDCSYDYVEVQDGSGELGKFCGSKLPDPIIVLSGILIVKFHTDYYRRRRGFLAEFNDNYDCLQITKAQNGEITSPRFPDNYPNNAVCIYLIQSVDRLPMKMTFKSFDVESNQYCKYDRVLVKDNIKEPAKHYGPFCGNMIPEIPIVYTGILVIVFISDEQVTSNGFSALIDYTLDCSGHLNASHGIIQSPNYPEDYDVDTNCTYRLSNVNNNSINLTFTDFSLEDSENCTWDYIEIRTSTDVSEKLCGSQDVPFYRIFKSNSTIYFHSDYRDIGRGFFASFTEIPEPTLTTELFLSSAKSTPSTTEFFTNVSENSSLKTTSLATVPASSELETSALTTWEFSSTKDASSSIEGQAKKESPVSIIIGIVLGIVAVTTLTILLILWYLRRNSTSKEQPHLQTAFSNENYNIQFINDPGSEPVPYTYGDTGYCNVENRKSKKNVVVPNYDLAAVIPIDQASEINRNSAKQVVDYIDQEESYNILNAHPKKSETTEVYDRTMESVYDSTKQEKDDMDIGLYDHTPSVDGVYN